ncbi:class A beta-lactamase-related serine hydrolase [Stenotrophomonas sp. ATCM1_4]|uniref:serine hydrolase domain-containing protein n=1 Tax=Stenotrophomonas sp. ATCM1_4 TaxID=2259330 RepID=UPI0010469339|nr:serine hydrolase domain-containing protein [Stenotrophomonas sp. ATCM1_4]TDB28392.1 class A beta-lactamase-related serine hydrolase [Stenotrophomonas sp. ATCM1_4]
MPSSKHPVVAIAAAFLMALPCFAIAASALEEANVSARKFTQKTMEEQHIPGLQLAVIKDGQVVLSENYGFANVENQVPVTSKTLFPINSATKSFTGVAMMQLVEAGRVDLDAPVSLYLESLPAAWQSIRVRQLLGHTSGLPDIVDQNGLIGGGNELEAWKVVEGLPMDAPVGDRFAYNQTNYGLLARIIVKQAQMPYERYLAERQFRVANMPTTTFGDSYDLIPGAATIYSRSPRGTLAKNDGDRLSHWFYDIPYSLWAGGGIQTTAEELSRWIIALTDGRMVSEAKLRRMWTPEKLGSGADGAWAMGWPVLQTSPHRQVAGIGGARAAFIVYPDDGLAVIVLTNLAGANPQNFVPRIAEFYKPLQRNIR